jgi:hypothetical protein
MNASPPEGSGTHYCKKARGDHKNVYRVPSDPAGKRFATLDTVAAAVPEIGKSCRISLSDFD